MIKTAAHNVIAVSVTSLPGNAPMAARMVTGHRTVTRLVPETAKREVVTAELPTVL